MSAPIKVHILLMWANCAAMLRSRRYNHTEVRDMRRTTSSTNNVVVLNLSY